MGGASTVAQRRRAAYSASLVAPTLIEGVSTRDLGAQSITVVTRYYAVLHGYYRAHGMFSLYYGGITRHYTVYASEYSLDAN